VDRTGVLPLLVVLAVLILGAVLLTQRRSGAQRQQHDTRVE